jgi:hypothetical protein
MQAIRWWTNAGERRLRAQEARAGSAAQSTLDPEVKTLTAVTGFNAWSQSQQVPADAHGNTVAFLCLGVSVQPAHLPAPV